jgi:ketosteroid isomerase-like protein
MSQENVDIVRRGYELFNNGDFEAWLATLSLDVELDERYLAPDATVYCGHEGVRSWWRAGREAVEPPRLEVLRWFDGGDAVVTDVTARVRGVGSGAETMARLAHALRIRDGKVVYIGSFATVDEALEAVGLSDQDAHAGS